MSTFHVEVQFKTLRNTRRSLEGVVKATDKTSASAEVTRDLPSDSTIIGILVTKIAT